MITLKVVDFGNRLVNFLDEKQKKYLDIVIQAIDRCTCSWKFLCLVECRI